MLILYGIAYSLDPLSADRALDRSLTLVWRLLPVLAVVALLLLVSNLLLRREWVQQNLGGHSGARGWLIAAVAGILAAGPVYTWYALLGNLRAKGMRTGLMSVFLYMRAVKLPLLPLLIHYFGLLYTLILIGYLILLSLPAALLLERLVGTNSPPAAGARSNLHGQDVEAR